MARVQATSRSIARRLVAQIGAIEYVVYGKPESQGSTRAFIPRGWTHPVITDSNRRLKPWRQALMAAAVEQHARHGQLSGAIIVELWFYLPRPKSAPTTKCKHAITRPDLDKLARAVLDSLSGTLLRDDAQVVTLLARKRYAGDPVDDVGGLARVEVSIERLDN